MAKTIHPYFKRRIFELVELGYSAPDILKTFEDGTPEALYDQMPSLRTIQRWVKTRGRDRRQEWKITDCENPEDAQIVFEALRAIFVNTPIIRKSPTITTEFADMIIRIKKAAPTLPAFEVARLAHLYLFGNAVEDIHILLSFKPFENIRFYHSYVANLKRLYGGSWASHALYKIVNFKDGEKIEASPVWDLYKGDLDLMGLNILEIIA